ncbi:MAG: PhoH family protein [Phycisphaerales bacterium]|nr:PhoH family protein [Phycisphaerales bacterium]
MEVTIPVPDGTERTTIFGPAERHLKLIREALGVTIHARGQSVHVIGDRAAVAAARRVLDDLVAASQQGRPFSRQRVLDALSEAARETPSPAFGNGETNGASHSDTRRDAWHTAPVGLHGRTIEPRTENQRRYLDAVESHDLVFAIGPAGTGKTYLAVAAAIHMLRTGRVKRAILTRPAVEAGEKLGFLPGDQFAKVNPYLRPLLDALSDMLEYTTLKQFLASDVIEIAPMAYMRGRTLNDAIVILDEAQNTTRGQMQMFLTRMGERSKMIVTGDVTQIDLPDPTQSGLIDAARRLRRVQGVAFSVLERSDVVRHPLVQRVIDAYAAEDHDQPTTGELLQALTDRASRANEVDDA